MPRREQFDDIRPLLQRPGHLRHGLATHQYRVLVAMAHGDHFGVGAGSDQKLGAVEQSEPGGFGIQDHPRAGQSTRARRRFQDRQGAGHGHGHFTASMPPGKNLPFVHEVNAPIV